MAALVAVCSSGREVGTVQFAVLGPMEVHDEKVDVTPPAAMPRRVLATLLLHADQVVPIPTLIEELWDDEPPRLARKTVQTYVYQLRKALACGPTGGVRQLLETRPQGYRILLEPDELDLRLFEQRARIGRSALAAGDLGGAACSLRDALSVWRGDALTDLVPGPVLSAQASRLEDARRGVLEQRVEADLRLGLHRELIGELKVLMTRYPGHEEFCAQLMVAAYRSGRRDESLAAYDRLRRVVVEQTGLEPSERLRRLQHAVLVDSPSLDSPEPGAPGPLREPPAELPPGPERIVGRTHELALIATAVRRRPAAAAPGLVVVAGGPGTGKTATALFAAHRLRERFPDGQLFAELHGESGLPADPLSVLQGFLRSVSPDEPPPSLQTAARRFRSWSADRRVLVVLDDAACAAQVAPLLPNGRGCGTVITSRRLLPELPGAAVVRLGPLDPCEALQLLSSIAGEPRVRRHPDAALELARLCDRNPFALKVAGERLAARALLDLPELVERLRAEEWRLGELSVGSLDVRARLLDAGRRLERDERAALRRLARLGAGRFDLAQATAALSVDERAARRLLNSLIDTFLLEDAAVRYDALHSDTAHNRALHNATMYDKTVHDKTVHDESMYDETAYDETAGKDPAEGTGQRLWTGPRFRLPALLRLTWSQTPMSEADTQGSRHRGVLCRTAARPHQSHSVRLLRYYGGSWGAADSKADV